MDVAPRRSRWPALLVGALLLGSCSDDEPGQGETQPPAADVVDTEGKPEVEVPDGQPPTELLAEDVVEGDGAEVVEGATLTLHYVMVTWSGTEVASSWDRGQPLSYQHGDGRWIEGWEAGIEGMREGGERRLLVPADLAYGERGAPRVPPDEALVVVVRLLDVE